MLQHDESPAAVQQRDSAFVLGTYKRTPFQPVRGLGAQLFDSEGKAYWDLLGGIAVNVLGHAHPRIVDALTEYSLEPLHLSNLYRNPAQGILAEELVRLSMMSRAFFCNSGTEANEAALKFAALANPGRTKLVALEESFHGRSCGALSLTGHEAYRAPFASLLPAVTFVAPGDIDALSAAVDEQTIAIFLEPIMGEGGVIPLTDEFLFAARQVADRSGAMLVFDEVQCGLGRTGKMFAFQHSGVVPDILTLAKPLGGGLPLGAVLVSEQVAARVHPGHHGTTFGGNPLACRLGAIVLEEVAMCGLLERVSSLGEWFGKELDQLASRTSAIVAVRGRGLMWGIELHGPAAEAASALLEKGFVVGTARENVLRLLPPYVIPREALEEFLVALETTLSAAAIQTRSAA